MNYICIILILNSIFCGYIDLNHNFDEENCIRIKDKLEKVYLKLEKDSLNKELQIEYVDCFPKSFDEFDILFGEKELDSIPLEKYKIEDFFIYIDLLLSIEKVPKSVLCKKTIGIVVDGEWQADAYNYYLYNLESFIECNALEFVNEFKKMSDDEILKFWCVMLNGPHPNKTIDKKWTSIFHSENRIMTLISEAHNIVMDNYDMHGH